MAILNSILRLSLLDQVSGPAKKISGVLGQLNRQTLGFMGPMRGMMGQLAALGVGYLGVTEGLRGTAGAAIEFESAFADVRKVVDASDEQFQNMRRTILQMSTEVPPAASDIAQLFAAAGESGVATTDLKEFSQIAARVGIAFNISAGEAGESLAKLKTQLGLSVADTGSLADAINHLSNNMASKASEVTDFMLRVSALGKIGGFTAEQIAGIGSAMIAAGAPAEIAGTAMQNVVKALTRGKFAKKDQQDAAAALGLHLPTIAKQMQKDAPKALKTVLAAIAKAPKDQQLAILSQFFGDEAKAFAPLVGNIQLLDQALGAVSDKTKYAGSAYKEFVARANTTGNVLQLLRNKFAEVGISIGDKMLPSIKEAALGIGHVIDTLGERAHIFSKVEAAMDGFLKGFGADGGVRKLIEDLGDLLLGPANGSEAADKIGRIFAKFEEWGAAVRSFTDAVAANPIARFFADMAPYGFDIFLWGVGITALTATIRGLAGALMLLSGASTIVALFKGLKGLSDIGLAGGGKRPPTGKLRPKTATKLPVPPLLTPALMGVAGTAALLEYGKHHIENDPVAKQRQADADARNAKQLEWLKSFFRDPGGTGDGVSARPDQVSPFNAPPVDDGSVSARPVRLDAATIQEMVRPSGTQDVRVTNQQPVTVTVSNSFVINQAADPQAVADQVMARQGEAVKYAVESSFSDGAF